MHRKLQLLTPDYEILDYWDNASQVDLLVTSKKDRICRVIECKWAKDIDSSWFDKLKEKKIPIPEGYTRQDFVILGGNGVEMKNRNEKNIILLEDLLVASDS